MDVHEYEQLLEKLELLQEIKLAEAQHDQKQGISHKNAKKMIMEKFKQ